MGALIRESCAVRALDLAGGRVAGVVTEAGRIACDHVVVAAGAWSRLFLARHGVNIPQLAVLATVAATEPMPEIFPGNAADDDFAFRRRADGGYSLAPGGAQHDFLPRARCLPLFRGLPSHPEAGMAVLKLSARSPDAAFPTPGAPRAAGPRMRRPI
jgi:glycine/D-amino acid oxidase-like deaminating enzyme